MGANNHPFLEVDLTWGREGDGVEEGEEERGGGREGRVGGREREGGRWVEGGGERG